MYTSYPQIFGDPHFVSFDGLGYDFNGQCDYVLAMDCEMGKHTIEIIKNHIYMLLA